MGDSVGMQVNMDSEPRGDCFEQTYKMFDNLCWRCRNLYYCAARVYSRKQQRRIIHAWIELDDRVLDYSNGVTCSGKKSFDKNEYYNLGLITDRDVRRFGGDEVRKRVSKYERYCLGLTNDGTTWSS